MLSEKSPRCILDEVAALGHRQRYDGTLGRAEAIHNSFRVFGSVKVSHQGADDAIVFAVMIEFQHAIQVILARERLVDLLVARQQADAEFSLLFRRASREQIVEIHAQMRPIEATHADVNQAGRVRRRS